MSNRVVNQRLTQYWQLALLVVTVFCVFPADLNSQENETADFRAEDIEFFENKIRPLLVEHCLQCHGDDEKKIRGGLRLTSREEILRGGDSGPAIVAGKPEESLLISSVRYEDFEMPPKGQLHADQIAALTKWIEMGAPDPRSGVVSEAHAIDIEAGRKFWAFAPRKSAQPPALDSQWPESTIDRFILSRLEASGIQPVADASRETLIRRAYVALIGLPPTITQIDDFLADDRPIEIAFASVVDDLLESKHFGERWGRHWLDVVRFAESSGGGRSLMFPDAWRFRDYVIDSFNADKPFDQFITEQIAGDLLPSDSHDQKIEQIVATGMLALGPTNYEQQDKELLRMEVIDEQVDTIGRAFLGLTLGCARCHDHKFDPIPMTDYYALAGIFGSTKTLVDGNVSNYVTRELATEKELAANRVYREQIEKLTKQQDKLKTRLTKLDPASQSKKKAVANHNSTDFPGLVMDDRVATKKGKWTESVAVKSFIDGHYLHDDNRNKGDKSVVFVPKFETGGRFEVRMSYTAGGNRASNTPVTIVHQDGQNVVLVNQANEPPIDGLFVSLGTFRFEADNEAIVSISTKGTDGHVIVDAIQFLREDGPATSPTETPSVITSDVAVELPQISIDEPPQPRSEVARLVQAIKALDQELKAIKKNGPPPVSKAMSVEDMAKPQDGHLHIRGSVRNLGAIVPRGFISVCSHDPTPKLAENESGRLQLADWIANADHPLTARVYVNRVWRHLFGQGLVFTTDNFGFVGQKPSHPELLDYLAEEFVRNGWSTKKLIREIMLSHVYRLSAENNATANAMDDRNVLLWRANRRRVDAEVLRDSILYVSGELDLTAGGRSIRKIEQYDLGYEFDTIRRSVYVPAFRNSMLDIFEVFDFANPNLVIGHRNTSTLPTQALFLMNNPMVMEQSQNMANRILAVPALTAPERIELAYRVSLARKPSPTELQSAAEYIDTMVGSSTAGDPSLAAWSSFCHALFASLDFRYVD